MLSPQPVYEVGTFDVIGQYRPNRFIIPVVAVGNCWSIAH